MLMRYLTRCKCPQVAAACSGVHFSESSALTLAPNSSSSFIMLSLSSMQHYANTNGFRPSTHTAREHRAAKRPLFVQVSDTIDRRWRLLRGTSWHQPSFQKATFFPSPKSHRPLSKDLFDFQVNRKEAGSYFGTGLKIKQLPSHRFSSQVRQILSFGDGISAATATFFSRQDAENSPTRPSTTLTYAAASTRRLLTEPPTRWPCTARAPPYGGFASTATAKEVLFFSLRRLPHQFEDERGNETDCQSSPEWFLSFINAFTP